MKISRKKATEERWVKYSKLNIEILIRSFPVSMMKTENNLEGALKLWNYCVRDWKGIDDEETGEPFSCNSDSKLFIYDHFQDVVVFVIEEINKMNEELAEHSKN